MNGRYHDGEIEAQDRAGVRELADRVGRIIRPTIATPAAEFLEAQTMVITATARRDGTVHASALCGLPGFARATAESSIEIEPSSGHVDTVFGDLAENSTLGLLAIEFSTRRRIRVNGIAAVQNGTIRVATTEVYANCPRFIEPRPDGFDVKIGAARSAASLSDRQRRLITSAKTFFIATVHPEKGADASHRGGPAGFVRVDGDRISWPDYAGNNMFNTVGNLLVNPRCGLLFIDFDTGATLQIEGTAGVRWDGERRIEVAVEGCVETDGAPV